MNPNDSSPAPESTPRFPAIVETVVAGILTLGVGTLHFLYFFHAGPLWQDEANSVNIASLPTLSEMWDNLQFESFPLLGLLPLRGWLAFGFTSDVALRVPGLVIGLAIVGALWWLARRFDCKAPLWSLAFFGMSVATTRYGDSIRAYGMGMLTALLFLGGVWRFVQKPDGKNYLLAGGLGILATQCLYQNCIIVFAVLCGAMAVFFLEHAWRTALAAGSIGLWALLSLVPYFSPWGPVLHVREWSMIIHAPIDFADVLDGLVHLYTWPFEWLPLRGWIAEQHDVIAVALMPVFVLLLSTLCWLATRGVTQRRLCVFLTTTLAIGIPAYFVFIKTLSYPISPAHPLACLGIFFVAVDVLAQSLVSKRRILRWLQLVAVVLVALVYVWFAQSKLRVPMSDIDDAAWLLRQHAGKDDLIVVMIWEAGVPLDRYYTGPTPWLTIPAIEDHRFHRYDLVKREMADDDAMSKVLSPIEATLARGGKVFLLDQKDPPREDVAPHPRPLPTENSMAYAHRCGRRLTEYLASYRDSASQQPLRIRRVGPEPIGPGFVSHVLLCVERK